MAYTILFLLLTFLSMSSATLRCPTDDRCQCTPPSETSREYQIYCSTEIRHRPAFLMAIRKPIYIKIQCQNYPDWKDFMFGSQIHLPWVQTLEFHNCDLPGPDNNEQFLKQLVGIDKVEILNVIYLNGNITKRHLDIFPNLNTLILSDNHLGEVEFDLLYGLPKLGLLYLSNTQVRIPQKFFEQSSELRLLDLTDNNLEAAHLWPGIFSDLKNLIYLNISYNPLQVLEAHVLRGISTLEFLDIRDTGLSMISRANFNETLKLKYLDMTGNKILLVEQNSFSHLKDLRYLAWEDNTALSNKTVVPPKCFGDLPMLNYVWIQGNGFQHLPEDFFYGSANLTILSLIRNGIETLPPMLLKDAVQLKALMLSSNRLTSIPELFFNSTVNLVYLKLNKNRITTIPKNLFDHLTSLEELNLEDNGLQTINPYAFYFLRNLKVAKLAHNHLDFSNDPSLSSQGLSPFYRCTKIKKLDLSHNHINRISEDWIRLHNSLDDINLSYNNITYIDVGDLQFVTKELHLNLSNNRIAIVNVSRLERMPIQPTSFRHILVKLDNNPIDCSCNIYSFLRYISGVMKPEFYKFIQIDHDDVRCGSPPDFRGIRLTQLINKQLNCSAENCVADRACDCLASPRNNTYTFDCSARNLTEPPAWIYYWDYRSAHIIMNLSNNSLTKLPNMSSNGYDGVHSVNLARNQIDSIDDNQTSSISPVLQSIHLEHNKLRKIDEPIMQRLTTHLESLWLRNNPWQCDNTTEQFRGYVQNFKLDVVKDYENVFCNGTSVPLWVKPWSLASKIIISISCIMMGSVVYLIYYVANRVIHCHIAGTAFWQ